MGADPVVFAADTTEAFAWTSGRWAFRDEPLAQVASELSRRLGLVVLVDSALATTSVYGDYANGSSGELLSVLALATGTHVTINSDTVRFLPAGAPR
jgi:ferric-dicitrate binding protein FerR (iron transport regulator)